MGADCWSDSVLKLRHEVQPETAAMAVSFAGFSLVLKSKSEVSSLAIQKV